MEERNLISFSFLLFFTLLILLFVLSDLPSPSSNHSSAKNRIEHSNLLKNPTYPIKRRRHSADVPHHPLDPLTVTELNRVKQIIQNHDDFKNRAYALHSVVLEEPEKRVVVAWRKGDTLPPRKAAVVARAGGASHVLSVDLASGEVTHRKTGHVSGYPTMTVEEMASVTWVPLVSADFNRTVVERGVDLMDLACLPISTGWFVKISVGRTKTESVKLHKGIYHSIDKVTPNSRSSVSYPSSNRIR